jgi:hypothetical protein
MRYSPVDALTIIGPIPPMTDDPPLMPEGAAKELTASGDLSIHKKSPSKVDMDIPASESMPHVLSTSCNFVAMMTFLLQTGFRGRVLTHKVLIGRGP